jgi:hypothetical protein
MSMTTQGAQISPEALESFYRQVLRALEAANVPFLLGGSHALELYAGVAREPKDLDLFLRHQDLPALQEALLPAGYQCLVCFPHWLGKIYQDSDAFIDVIFNSGNGLCAVDDAWFHYSRPGTFLGRSVRLCPLEEMIWSKAFIMERERFDGADIAHFLRLWAPEIDWKRLLWRFGKHFRVLLSHVVLFGYIYPGLRRTIPDWVMRELLLRLQHEPEVDESTVLQCFGTLLTRQQYLPDIDSWGYVDARLEPNGNMSSHQVESWTFAIDGSGPSATAPAMTPEAS